MVDRREALSALLLLPTVAGVSRARSTLIGYMDLHRWMAEGYYARDARVFCNGVDITGRCRWFDDTTGEAGCIVWPTRFTQDGTTAMETVRGVIEVRG